MSELVQNEKRTPSVPPRLSLRYAQMALDLGCLLAAYALAHALRFDFDVPSDEAAFAATRMPFVIAYQVALVWFVGIYRFVWRYVGLREVGAFVRGALLTMAPLLALRLALPVELHAWRMPISVTLLDATLAFGSLLAVRVARRVVFEHLQTRSRQRATGSQGRAVLLVGAGRAGILAARELHGNPDTDLDVVGFVDDDPAKLGAVMEGVRVLGRTEDIADLARGLNVDHVIITIAAARRGDLRRIVDQCDRAGLPVRIIPGLYEILGGRVEVSRVRDVQIEDLLGREPVQLDEDVVGALIRDAVVMVTGAGGSIGSELCRQIARFEPARLVLLERSEPALFQIHREIEASFPSLRIEPIVADVSDRDRMAAVLDAHRPRVVLHAAAHKHVPLMERNVCEAIRNNVLGTYELGRLCATRDVKVFVLVSTDKAVRPSSVMGATKRAAELVIQYLESRYETHFVAVRFGNVLGSAGSVIPIFREQIARGGPVTVTHPEMSRYFMTIPEASQLVLQAGAMGAGGEIFILDMGEPVRIVDLARDMIRLSGLRPDEDIHIEYTGVRPGEKLVEELASGADELSRTRHTKIAIGRIAPVQATTIERGLEALKRASADGDDQHARDLLAQLVPDAHINQSSVARTSRPSDTGSPLVPAARAVP